jgi:hypothetical protein
MNLKRIINIGVLALGVVAAFYYTAANQEGQGAVVLLLGILYFVALPHVSDSSA